MIKNNSNKELTVPYIPVMTFDEIVAVKDFRKKKDTPKESARSSQDGKMPLLSNASPDKNKSPSPLKKDHAVYQTN
jgi:hypothetical protein